MYLVNFCHFGNCYSEHSLLLLGHHIDTNLNAYLFACQWSKNIWHTVENFTWSYQYYHSGVQRLF